MNEKGIVHIAILLILIAGLGAGLYLIQNTQIFKPRASFVTTAYFVDTSGTRINQTVSSQVFLKIVHEPVTSRSNVSSTPSPSPAGGSSPSPSPQGPTSMTQAEIDAQSRISQGQGTAADAQAVRDYMENSQDWRDANPQPIDQTIARELDRIEGLINNGNTSQELQDWLNALPTRTTQNALRATALNMRIFEATGRRGRHPPSELVTRAMLFEVGRATAPI